MRALIALALVVACGGRAASPPAPPPPPTPAQLVATLFDDFVVLGQIAERHRGRCPELVAELRPHVARMRGDADAVNRASQDPRRAAELRAEAATYDARVAPLADATAEALAASYLACKSPELLELVNQLPHW